MTALFCACRFCFAGFMDPESTLYEVLRFRLRFSRESRQYNSRLIPAVTRLQGVTVTGAENG